MTMARAEAAQTELELSPGAGGDAGEDEFLVLFSSLLFSLGRQRDAGRGMDCPARRRPSYSQEGCRLMSCLTRRDEVLGTFWLRGSWLLWRRRRCRRRSLRKQKQKHSCCRLLCTTT